MNSFSMIHNFLVMNASFNPSKVNNVAVQLVNTTSLPNIIIKTVSENHKVWFGITFDNYASVFKNNSSHAFDIIRIILAEWSFVQSKCLSIEQVTFGFVLYHFSLSKGNVFRLLMGLNNFWAIIPFIHAFLVNQTVFKPLDTDNLNLSSICG